MDDVQAHPDVAHVDLHRGLGVLVLQEDLDPVAGADLRRLADALDQPRPALAVGRLERVVVALDPGPDDEVSAQLGGEVRRRARDLPRRLAHAGVDRGEAALAEAMVDVQAAGDRVDAVAAERLTHLVEVVLAELPGVVELVVVDEALEPGHRAPHLVGRALPAVLRLVALRHEARDHPAQRPDPELVFTSVLSQWKWLPRRRAPRSPAPGRARPRRQAAGARRRGRRARSRSARACRDWRARPRSSRSRPRAAARSPASPRATDRRGTASPPPPSPRGGGGRPWRNRRGTGPAPPPGSAPGPPGP